VKLFGIDIVWEDDVEYKDANDWVESTDNYNTAGMKKLKIRNICVYATLVTCYFVWMTVRCAYQTKLV